MVYIKKVLIGITVLIILIGGLYLFSNKKSITPSDASDIGEEVIKEEVEEVEKEVSIEDNPNTKKAGLVDVSGGNSLGIGYVLREDGELEHYIYAELPKLSGGNMYEGWLVKQTPTLSFFSTGVMQETGDGIF